MKKCKSCGSKETSQWYKGPLCKSCYIRSPKGRAAIIKRQTKPQVRFSKSKRQAISRGKVWEISLEEFCALLERPCVYCKNQLGTKDGFSSGLDRIDNAKGYILSNVVSCCHICNTMRNQFLTVEETKVAVDAILCFRKSNEESSMRRIRKEAD